MEAFSELAVLGPKMKIGDYPNEVSAGDPFSLFLYVKNHEGRVMHYAIKVKLGNITTLINGDKPMTVPVLLKHEVILLHGANWTKPIILSIAKAGVNYRLVFELWVYDQNIRNFNYHGRWCQLWLNVTKSTS